MGRVEGRDEVLSDFSTVDISASVYYSPSVSSYFCRQCPPAPIHLSCTTPQPALLGEKGNNQKPKNQKTKPLIHLFRISADGKRRHSIPIYYFLWPQASIFNVGIRNSELFFLLIRVLYLTIPARSRRE